MAQNKRANYTFEFLSIFIAVVAAFALQNWNENRRDNLAADKILTEISNGLKKDLDDININVSGHEEGIKACKFFRKIMRSQEVQTDSLIIHYFGFTRDYFSAQNRSGYETLKSRGLELIKNDSLRLNIISIYEYDFMALKTLEEDYSEMQFHENYFKEINRYLAPQFIYDDNGNMIDIKLPLNLKEDERKILLSYLWQIQVNRQFILSYYGGVKNKVNELITQIEREISE